MLGTLDARAALGFEGTRSTAPAPEELLPVIQLKLLATGLQPHPHAGGPDFSAHTADLIRKIQAKFRSYPPPLCPLDTRIQAFLDAHFGDIFPNSRVELPTRALHMDFHGLARALSLPATGDYFESEHLKSYRILQGVLHNPASDKRTTKGTFHLSEGGLPIPSDKKAVPKPVFARLLRHALNPPADLLRLPFTTDTPKPAGVFTSLFIRPVVSPEVPGVRAYKNMEIRFFAPGSLVSNLDFVESIFGNAGDPYLPENDAALDAEHFCGVTGCVVLAPHLTKLSKKELGLPHVSEATPAQKKQGMCWKEAGELYNDGQAFKAVFRTAEGVIVTMLADNYFGYCKKEVKSQISFACNLIGNCEEEHSGGALVFAGYSLGDYVQSEASFIRKRGYTFGRTRKSLGKAMDTHPDGYGIDRRYPNLIYLPEDADISLPEQKITWSKDGRARVLKLLTDHVYIYPSGYKVRMEKHPDAPSWRLIGTVAEGVLCHKPSTVSGGGKSEISKSVSDSILYHPFYIQDFNRDFAAAEKILFRDFGDRFRATSPEKAEASRELLNPGRSLGSVVRLLTPSSEYNEHYNNWIKRIPPHVRALIFLIKRFYRPHWGSDIRGHFSVDVIDGRPGHELNVHHRKVVSSYLKVGTDEEGHWRVFRLRLDFVPADKLQTEDDITVSTTLPISPESRSKAAAKKSQAATSVKFVQNCEYRLFQRPDDAIHRGRDKQAEKDLAGDNVFISNFEPLTADNARDMWDNAIESERFSAPMHRLIMKAATKEKGYFVCSANPRLVDGKPSANVRYLQNRPDLVDPVSVYVAETAMRLKRKLSPADPLSSPVDSVLMGRRNNPPDHEAGIKPLAVYNPLHFQELPEAFMDFIASPTGKSPSTTGAGSEGALTKGPFNALWPTADLNAALVSYILTGIQIFSTPAGHIGSKYRVDHDLSLLMPELWCRLQPEEKDARKMIAARQLSQVNDFRYRGRTVPAGRLGYRINERFLHALFGRVFSDPLSVFPPDMLEPEKQGLRDFADGVENIAEAQRAAAQQYFDDGSVETACPPLHALLHIMAKGSWKSMDLQSPALRRMFTATDMLKSEWYKRRLERQREKDEALWRRHGDYLRDFLALSHNKNAAARLNLRARLALADAGVENARKHGYAEAQPGMLGSDPQF